MISPVYSHFSLSDFPPLKVHATLLLTMLEALDASRRWARNAPDRAFEALEFNLHSLYRLRLADMRPKVRKAQKQASLDIRREIEVKTRIGAFIEFNASCCHSFCFPMIQFPSHSFRSMSSFSLTSLSSLNWKARVTP